jgi:hypothetical protein
MRRRPSRSGFAAPGSCRTTPVGEITSYDDVVDAYIREYRSRSAEEAAFYRRFRSLAEAIRHAALCMRPNGKRHSHQCRIPAEALREGERNLQASAEEIWNCHTFPELHEIVRREIGAIRGIGSLTIYDVTCRIAAHRTLEPMQVYLHAGVSDGARAPGLPVRRESLDPAELPPAFQRLSVSEMEDCLCIYKRELAADRRGTKLKVHR